MSLVSRRFPRRLRRRNLSSLHVFSSMYFYQVHNTKYTWNCLFFQLSIPKLYRDCTQYRQVVSRLLSPRNMAPCAVRTIYRGLQTGKDAWKNDFFARARPIFNGIWPLFLGIWWKGGLQALIPQQDDSAMLKILKWVLAMSKIGYKAGRRQAIVWMCLCCAKWAAHAGNSTPTTALLVAYRLLLFSIKVWGAGACRKLFTSV